MYTVTNFKTKKALKAAVAAGGPVRIFNPGEDITGIPTPKDGIVYLEGPHFPKPHTWYAKAEVRGGIVVKVS